jgi:hypothetical protein
MQRKDPKKTARRRALRSFFITLILLIVGVPIGLICWPHAAIDVPIQTDPSAQVERFLEEVARRRGTGVPVPRTVFSQRNLNAFLGEHSDPGSMVYSGILVSETSILLVINEPFGPIELSTRLILEPPEEETGPFTATNLWIGHFPVSPRLAKAWTQAMAERLELGLHRDLWNEITLAGVGRSGGVVVDVNWETP